MYIKRRKDYQRAVSVVVGAPPPMYSSSGISHVKAITSSAGDVAFTFIGATGQGKKHHIQV